MKRIISMLCCIAVIGLMTACGNRDNRQETTEAQRSSTIAETETILQSESDYGESESSTETSKETNTEIEETSETQPQLENTAESPSTEPKTTSDTLQNQNAEQTKETASEEFTVTKINVQIGNSTFTATLENNQAVNEFVQMMQEAPVVINMSDYSGFEKVGDLGRSLTTSSSQTNTQAGDIVLYSGNQIVMFYGTHSWSYTRLAKIDDLSGWADALGSGNVQATFSIGE